MINKIQNQKTKNNLKKFICIECPKSCEIEINYIKKSIFRKINSGDAYLGKKMDEIEILSIKGNECKKGKAFVTNELINPKRMITTTIFVESKQACKLPVRSEDPVPKELLLDILKEIKKVKVRAPVKSGEIIAKNVLKFGINIISCISLDK